MIYYDYISLGLILALSGSILWFLQEKYKILLSINIFVAITTIVVGAIIIVLGLNKSILKDSSIYPRLLDNKNYLIKYFFIMFLIYVGSLAYTIAAFYHLKIKNWSFALALAVAVPFILIEYQFSLRGNFYARHILNMNAVQIVLLTMIFYFINSWLLNYFFLKNNIVWYREILAFILIICAFLITTTKII